MSRALVFWVVLVGCGARTDVDYVMLDTGALDAATTRDACTDGPAHLTEGDGRPLRCGERACDVRSELCFDCGGGGGFSGPSACVPLGGCASECDPCRCARPLVSCSYDVYCTVRNGVLTLSCPPD